MTTVDNRMGVVTSLAVQSLVDRNLVVIRSEPMRRSACARYNYTTRLSSIEKLR